jgi:hypothetical protein
LIGFVAKPGRSDTALVASAVSRARHRGYAELEHGVAPGKSVRHSLGFAEDSDARVEEVLWRSLPLRKLLAAQLRGTAADAGCGPRGTGRVARVK